MYHERKLCRRLSIRTYHSQLYPITQGAWLYLDPNYKPQGCQKHLHDAKVAQPLLHAPWDELPQCMAIAQVAHRTVSPGVQRAIKGDSCKIGICRAGMGLHERLG